MKGCELCGFMARAYCESDQASLCWNCDAKVHGANFLVARHSRTLLCQVCQSLTAWSASGPKLGSAVSMCERCVGCCGGAKHRAGEENGGGNDDEINTEDECGQDGDDEEEEVDSDDGDDELDVDVDVDVDGDDGDEADNQVVPWTCTPPPPVASSSGSEESSSRFFSCDRKVFEPATEFSLERIRENASNLSFQRIRENASNPSLQDDLECAPCRRNHSAGSPAEVEPEADAVDSSRPSRDRRSRPDRPVRVQSGSRSVTVFDSLKKSHDQEFKRLKTSMASGERVSKADG
ncbi:uncharacterized protein LOC131149580 [Malania oleifera]|uniref:uncharacterized protein LOC131149580 n=1 Tax=Malania oleifera TaxID=397392 RepID=UPI0025AE488A|nr:uncharacterized protein LOC131149580 [Malania oleifera]